MSHRFTHSRIVFELCCQSTVGVKSSNLVLGVYIAGITAKRLVFHIDWRVKPLCKNHFVFKDKLCESVDTSSSFVCVRVTSETVDKVGRSVLFVSSHTFGLYNNAFE